METMLQTSGAVFANSLTGCSDKTTEAFSVQCFSGHDATWTNGSADSPTESTVHMTQAPCVNSLAGYSDANRMAASGDGATETSLQATPAASANNAAGSSGNTQRPQRLLSRLLLSRVGRVSLLQLLP
ncbi:imp4 [Symbiodinium sp. CCMP2592]|nr:imp4 [Symbiodinium sp. CCMP2592]